MQNSSGPEAGVSPLTSLHKELGAVMPEVSGDSQVPVHFGSKESEYRQLRRGCGLIDTSARSTLVITGADRVRFLSGMVTGDIASLQVGQGLYCFFTTARGRILSDAVVLVQDDQITLLLPPGMATEIATHLRKFVVADRVEMASTTDQIALRLLGPTSPVCLGECLAGEGVPEDFGQHQVAMIGESNVDVLAEGLGEIPGFTLLVKRDEAAAISRALLDTTNGNCIVPCGSAAFESARIEAGALEFGKDFSVENFPKETGIDAAVSYTKGCYLGQEVVARIHYRGQVNRLARGLVFTGEASAVRTAVQSAGRDIGTLSSATHSPLLDRGVGLAILLRSEAEPNAQVDLADGQSATVVELPFQVTGE